MIIIHFKLMGNVLKKTHVCHTPNVQFLNYPLAGARMRGWFPRRCVEKCHYDTATTETTSEEKKVN